MKLCALTPLLAHSVTRPKRLMPSTLTGAYGGVERGVETMELFSVYGLGLAGAGGRVGVADACNGESNRKGNG